MGPLGVEILRKGTVTELHEQKIERVGVVIMGEE
jgi:hypothetical protein